MNQAKKKKRIYISLVTTAIIIPVLLGLSYAYYLTNVKGNNTPIAGAATSKFNINLVTTNGGYITATEMIPIDSYETDTKAETARFSVVSGNNKYKVAYRLGVTDLDISSNLENQDFKWVLTNIDTDESYSGNFGEATETGYLFMDDPILISQNSSDSYELKLYILETDADQSAMMHGTFSARVYLESELVFVESEIIGVAPSGWNRATSGALYTLKTNSNVTTEPAPTFSVLPTGYPGLFAATDNYGTSYYYRGAANNNWLEFAGYTWRIVRINGDGTIRIVYQGPGRASAQSSTDGVVVKGSTTYLTTMAYNDEKKSSEYVGYMYTLGQQHGTGTSSTIKTYLDTWYSNNLSAYTSKIADIIFCNDRTVTSGTGIGKTNNTFTGQTRVKADSPIITCTEKSDSFTVSDTTYGNGALTYPIGLLTADEYIMAGTRFGAVGINTSLYLYNDANTWTMTPYNSSPEAGMVHYSNTGRLNDNDADDDTNVVRPVIGLKPTVTLTGTGTKADPFVVQN